MTNRSVSVVGEESDLPKAIAAYRSNPGILPLKPAIQHYAWGDPNFIPALLGDENSVGKPCAELWMGAHPDAPAGAVLGGCLVPLDQLLDRAIAIALAQRAYRRDADGVDFAVVTLHFLRTRFDFCELSETRLSFIASAHPNQGRPCKIKGARNYGDPLSLRMGMRRDVIAVRKLKTYYKWTFLCRVAFEHSHLCARRQGRWPRFPLNTCRRVKTHVSRLGLLGR